jgi:hypothetical protein
MLILTTAFRLELVYSEGVAMRSRVIRLALYSLTREIPEKISILSLETHTSIKSCHRQREKTLG